MANATDRHLPFGGPRAMGMVWLCCAMAALWCASASPVAAQDAAAGRQVTSDRVRLHDLPQGARDVVLVTRDGQMVYEVKWDDGTTTGLTPEVFASRLYDDTHKRALWKRFLNISGAAGILWVSVGLGGQILFTGRMVVQWLVSERARRSMVPPAFWWMSLIGASMLILYFIWRRDAVGVLGQGTGWLIYVRNIWMIYNTSDTPPTIGDDPAPEAELSQ